MKISISIGAVLETLYNFFLLLTISSKKTNKQIKYSLFKNHIYIANIKYKQCEFTIYPCTVYYENSFTLNHSSFCTEYKCTEGGQIIRPLILEYSQSYHVSGSITTYLTSCRTCKHAGAKHNAPLWSPWNGILQQSTHTQIKHITHTHYMDVNYTLKVQRSI